jgi:hypothetical protein
MTIEFHVIFYMLFRTIQIFNNQYLSWSKYRVLYYEEINKVDEPGDGNQLFGAIGREHWRIYVGCYRRGWKAYDLESRGWIQVPSIPGEKDLVFEDRSLAVGRDLLVFGSDFSEPTLLRYSILTNSWIQTTDCYGHWEFG